MENVNTYKKQEARVIKKEYKKVNLMGYSSPLSPKIDYAIEYWSKKNIFDVDELQALKRVFESGACCVLDNDTTASVCKVLHIK